MRVKERIFSLQVGRLGPAGDYWTTVDVNAAEAVENSYTAFNDISNGGPDSRADDAEFRARGSVVAGFNVRRHGGAPDCRQFGNELLEPVGTPPPG